MWRIRHAKLSVAAELHTVCSARPMRLSMYSMMKAVFWRGLDLARSLWVSSVPQLLLQQDLPAILIPGSSDCATFQAEDMIDMCDEVNEHDPVI